MRNIIISYLTLTTMKSHKKQIGTLADYVKANRKASREEEILAHGKPVSSRPAVFKSPKVYDRKRQKKDIPDMED